MEYTLTLTDDDLKLLSAALGQLPYNTVAPLILKIGGQIADQEEKDE